MSRRFVWVFGVAAVIMAAVVVLLKLASVPRQAQAQTATGQAVANTGSAPKTAWGDPDLQGIWTDEYQIPLQRPAQYADREFFTDVEIAELDTRRAEAPVVARVAPRGSEYDVSGAYNAVFLSRKRTGRRTSLIVDPPDGRIPPLTPEAQKRNNQIREYQRALLQAVELCRTTQEGVCAGVKFTGRASPRRAEVPPHYLMININRADGPEDRSKGERCMGAVLPDFGAFPRIVQSPGSVAIFYDTGQGQGWQRNILVDGSPHLPSHVRQRFGDSRGRWEGDTLVVDVTNFSPKTDFRGARENLHLVERWTRLDSDTLGYTVTIEDPTTWMRPWTVQQELTRQDEQANRIYYEPRCHEGNYGMAAILRGSRVEEQAFAEGRGSDPATKCYVVCLPEVDGANPLR